MPRTVQLADEGEVVTFAHPHNCANLFFEVTVKDGVLAISAYHCSRGPVSLSIQPMGASYITVTMPNPPGPAWTPAKLKGKVA